MLPFDQIVEIQVQQVEVEALYLLIELALLLRAVDFSVSV